ncbi:MAG: lysophospholipase [Alphaproteobacteria bacterium]|nr:lysophospholipase [Alphaproteobacteria bacterium]
MAITPGNQATALDPGAFDPETLDPGEIVQVEAADGRRLKGRLWRGPADAPLLVAAHGVMSHSLWFHQLAGALGERGISLLAFDRRGAGMLRDDPGEPEDEQTLIDDLDAWLAFAADLAAEIHLVGFCWGANYALHYLGKRPDRVRSLILMAPGVVPASTIALRRSIDDLSPDEALAIPLKLEDFTQGPALDGFLRPDPLRLIHTSARFIGIQNRIGRFSAAHLVRLRLPLLAILASIDQISDNARTREFLTKARAAPKEIVELPGRHGIIFDAPDQTADACRTWLDRLDQG